ITDISSFSNGYGVRKWKNVTSAGTPGSNPIFPDTDFPIFRLGEAYLIYAEAVVRGGNGTIAQAATYINRLRERAYGNTTGNISVAALDLDFLIDERARELHWEGKRRTDLIRFNRFTSNTYLWPWKGGVPSGTGVASFRNIYPIPAAEINTNPNLDQNEGY
ncbi:MAG: RagB/SusD family nutrient uptake outer membrane protein, partial [Flavisolibacter sp.]